MSIAKTFPEQQQRFTVEEFLAFERAAEERHEFFDGEIVAMAGEKLNHGIISTNIIGSLGSQLKGTPCFTLTKDTKVGSGLGVASSRLSKGMFSYPDVLVVCGEPELFDDHQDIIMNPTAILEVLSKSTELFDRVRKFRRYRSWNPTLKDYVLVDQTQHLVEHFKRDVDPDWKMHEAVGLEAIVTFSGIPCTLKLADIYDRIEFAPESDEESPET